MRFKFNKKEFKKVMSVSMLTLVCVFIMSSLSFAARMPWETPMEIIKNSVSGPVALGVSLCAIVACGIALVFGGDMQGFIRQALYLALVIAIIIAAGNVLEIAFKDRTQAEGQSSLIVDYNLSVPVKGVK